MTSSQTCVNALVVCCFSDVFTTIFKIIVNKLGKYNLATYICKTKANKMTKINYKGFEIHLADKSHSALIYKGAELVKCIAGDIFADGTNNREEKAKKYIDSL